ncbi:MAG: hypothetical protein WC785_04290 [Tatlockia sp.]|jgi:hypothetical protein
MRHYSPVSYNGTSFGALNKIPLTFLIQWAGELPFISVNLLPSLWLSSSSYWMAVFLFLSSGLLVYRVVDRVDFKGFLPLLGMSLTFQFIPALLIAVSKGYQDRLYFGISHVPVFLQQIGFCMMLTFLFMRGMQFVKKSSALPFAKGGVALVISLVISASFLLNQSATNLTNFTLRYPREMYEKALTLQLLNSLPKNAIVIKQFLPGEMVWNSRELRAELIHRPDIRFFDLTTGKPANTDLLYDSALLSLPTNAPLYYLDLCYLPDSPKAGYVLLAHIQKQAGKLPTLDLQLNQVKLFYQAKSREDLQKITFLLLHKYPKLPIDLLQARSTVTHAAILPLDGELSYQT